MYVKLNEKKVQEVGFYLITAHGEHIRFVPSSHRNRILGINKKKHKYHCYLVYRDLSIATHCFLPR